MMLEANASTFQANGSEAYEKIADKLSSEVDGQVKTFEASRKFFF